MIVYDEYPKRITPPNQASKASKFSIYLSKRWQEGERNYHQLWREIKEQGFDGSFVSAYSYSMPPLSDKDCPLCEKHTILKSVYSNFFRIGLFLNEPVSYFGIKSKELKCFSRYFFS